MSAASDDTSSPVQPPASAPGKDVVARLEAAFAGTIKARTERTNATVAKRKEKKKRAKDARTAMTNAAAALERLTREAALDEQGQIIDRIALRGLKVAEGLLLERGADGYNADADVPMPEATTRTHFGMKVYQQMMANKRDNNANLTRLGVVLLQGRMEEGDWNAEAKRVDEEARRAHAVDVAAEMVREDER